MASAPSEKPLHHRRRSYFFWRSRNLAKQYLNSSICMDRRDKHDVLRSYRLLVIYSHLSLLMYIRFLNSFTHFTTVYISYRFEPYTGHWWSPATRSARRSGRPRASQIAAGALRVDGPFPAIAGSPLFRSPIPLVRLLALGNSTRSSSTPIEEKELQRCPLPLTLS